MHELAITQNIVEGIVERTGEAHILSLQLEVGKLSGVIPEAIRFCFDLVSEGTPWRAPGWTSTNRRGARCSSCGAEFSPQGLIVLCDCGGSDVELLCGTGQRIRSVEVV